jgi:hypothetical protein
VYVVCLCPREKVSETETERRRRRDRKEDFRGQISWGCVGGGWGSSGEGFGFCESERDVLSERSLN